MGREGGSKEACRQTGIMHWAGSPWKRNGTGGEGKVPSSVLSSRCLRDTSEEPLSGHWRTESEAWFPDNSPRGQRAESKGRLSGQLWAVLEQAPWVLCTGCK